MDIRHHGKGPGLFLESHQKPFWQVLLRDLSLAGLSQVVVSVPKVVNLVSWM